MPTTWSATAKNANVNLSNGDLTASTATGGIDFDGRSDTSVGSGVKRYWEITIDTAESNLAVGVGNASLQIFDFDGLGKFDTGLGYYSGAVYRNNALVTTLGTYTTGDKICIALDGGNKIWFRKNGGDWNDSPTDNPATNTGGIDVSAMGDLYAAYNVRNGAVLTGNFGATSFAQTPPSGYSGDPGGSVGAAAGASTAAGIGAELARGAGAAPGAGSASGIGAGNQRGAGTASAASAATGAGVAVQTVIAIGAAAGAGTANAPGVAAKRGVGAATGESTALALSELFAPAPPLTFPAVPPREFIPKTLRVRALNTTLTIQSVMTGQQIEQPTNFERWEMEIELPVMIASKGGDRVIGFLESLRGMVGTFEFGNPKKQKPRGAARITTGNPIVSAIAHNDREIPIQTSLGNVAGYLKAGDHISIGLGLARRLYRTLRDVDLAAGFALVDVWPRLRTALVVGEPIYTHFPTALFRLDTPQPQHAIDENGWIHFDKIPIVQVLRGLAVAPGPSANITTGIAFGSGDAAAVGGTLARGIGIAVATSSDSGIAGGLAQARLTEASDTRITEDGDRRILEGGSGVGGNIAIASAFSFSSALAIGRTFARGTGVASGIGSTAGIGNTGTILTGIGGAAATSTATGVGMGSGGTIVADGDLLSLSIDGIAWGP